MIDTADGHRWFETYKSPVKIEGQTIGTVGFARDVTESHDRHLALKRSERKYRRFIEKMPLGVAILQDGILKYLNPKGIELLGIPREACVGQSFLPLIFEADRQSVSEADKSQTLGANPFELRLLSRAGQVIDCLTHVSRVKWEDRVAVLAIFEDITEKKRAEGELRRLASIDLLTELATRQHFMAHLEQALSRLKRGADQQAAVLVLDLDHFDSINEALGRLAGDAVLRLFSALLRDKLRKVDFAGRIGDERFTVLLPETDRSAASVFAERLRKKVAGMSIRIDERQVSVTVSIGLAVMSVDDNSADQGLRLADQALSAAKKAGGNQVVTAEQADIA